MTLAIDLINRAFRLIGNNKFGDSGDASEYIDALQSLNDMISDWSLTERLLQYKQALISYAITTTATGVTIGPTGNIVTSYVGTIASPYIRIGTTDYPLTMLNSQEYADIKNKSISGGIPQYYYYDASTPNSTLYLYPSGSSGQTLIFNAQQPLQVFAGLQDTVTIPDHYNRAIAYNLAVEIAPEYGQDAPPRVVMTAASTKRKLKQMNFKPSVMQSEAARLRSGGGMGVSSGSPSGDLVTAGFNYVITG